MLIYQGDALERQAALPEEEQKHIYAVYQGINETPGVTPGLPMGLPENATTVRVEGGYFYLMRDVADRVRAVSLSMPRTGETSGYEPPRRTLHGQIGRVDHLRGGLMKPSGLATLSDV